jgi:hypothetical protein
VEIFDSATPSQYLLHFWIEHTHVFDPVDQGSHFQPAAPIHRIKMYTSNHPAHRFFLALILSKDHTIALVISKTHLT